MLQMHVACNPSRRQQLMPKMCVRQVYTRLNERLGLADHLLVLNVMLTKIGTNLKVFGSCEDVVEQTLTLFQARAHAVL